MRQLVALQYLKGARALSSTAAAATAAPTAFHVPAPDGFSATHELGSGRVVISGRAASGENVVAICDCTTRLTAMRRAKAKAAASSGAVASASQSDETFNSDDASTACPSGTKQTTGGARESHGEESSHTVFSRGENDAMDDADDAGEGPGDKGTEKPRVAPWEEERDARPARRFKLRRSMIRPAGYTSPHVPPTRFWVSVWHPGSTTAFVAAATCVAGGLRVESVQVTSPEVAVSGEMQATLLRNTGTYQGPRLQQSHLAESICHTGPSVPSPIWPPRQQRHLSMRAEVEARALPGGFAGHMPVHTCSGAVYDAVVDYMEDLGVDDGFSRFVDSEAMKAVDAEYSFWKKSVGAALTKRTRFR